MNVHLSHRLRVQPTTWWILLSIVVLVPRVHAQQEAIEAVVIASDTHAFISPYLYGQFLEHAGDLVNDGLWAEMLDDRKFYYPVVETEPEPAPDAMQPNDVGTDEFITLCRLVGIEPYITVNAGFGDAWSAAQLVEYTNGSEATTMGRLRAANGHPEPYGVRFWGVGNEAWGSWQMGSMPPDQFVLKHNLFADAMRAVDSTIVLIGSGAMPDAMTGSGESQKRTGKIVPEPMGPADWTGGLFLHSLDHMDMISEHYYNYGGTRFDVTQGKQVPVDANEPLVDWMRRPANHVRMKVEAYEDYEQRIPALSERPIPIVHRGAGA